MPKSSLHRLLPIIIFLLSVSGWVIPLFPVNGSVMASFPSLVTSPYFPPNRVEAADIHLVGLRISGGPSLLSGSGSLPPESPIPGSLVGVAAVSVTPHGGAALVVPAPYPDPNGSPEAFDLHYEVILPHSLDSIGGCVDDGATLRPVNDEGVPLANSLLLLERGNGCNFQAKIDAATAAGVAVLIIYNCAICTPGMARISADSSIPVFFMQLEDGQFLQQYLLGRRAFLGAGVSPIVSGVNYSLPLTGTLTGTGPIVPSESAALIQIANHLQMDPSALADNSILRNWNDLLSEPTKDPCLDRLVGVWCERGHITLVWLKYLTLSGSFDPAFGDLTHLRDLALGINRPAGLIGDVPTSICALADLRSLSVEENQLTSLPDCLGASQPLLTYLQADVNYLTTIPTGLRNVVSLVYLELSRNSIPSLPSSVLSNAVNLAKINLGQNPLTSFSGIDFTKGFPQLQELLMTGCLLTGNLPEGLLTGAPALSSLDLSGNSLTGAIPEAFFQPGSALINLNLAQNRLNGALPLSLIRHTALEVINLSKNQFVGEIPSTFFDGMSSLSSISLAFNNFAGSLPSFDRCPRLILLEAQHNQFSGGLPIAWIDPTNHIATLSLSFNLLDFNGTTDVLSRMPSISAAYLDHNRLVVDHRDEGDVGRTMFRLLGGIISTLNIQNNLLEGIWGVGFTEQFVNIQNLNISTNRIRMLPDDFWLMNRLVNVDLSENDLQSTLPDSGITQVAGLSSLHLEGNPSLTLPDWIEPSNSAISISKGTDLYQCLELFSPLYPLLAIKADPASLQYRACSCKQGAYGTPPNCTQVPISTSVTVDGGSTAYAVYNSSRPMVDSFSDLTFAPQPLGMATSWNIDLSTLRQDGTGFETGGHSSIDASTIGLKENLQPVRILFVRLHISRTYFTTAEDTLSIFNAEKQSYYRITGEDVQSGRAMNDFSYDSSSNRADLPDPTSAAYLAFYNASLATIQDSVLLDFRIPANSGIVSFTTKGSIDQRPMFFGTYGWSYDCMGLRLLNADLGHQCLATVADIYVASRNGTYDYECLALTDLVSPIRQSLTNPRDVDFQGCRCSTGTFGLPPHCDRVPLNATVTSHAPPTADVKYALVLMANPDLLDLIPGGESNSTRSEGINLPPSFTDAWYGDGRLTRGLSTAWTIDLRTLRRMPGNDTDLVDHPAVSATAVGENDPLQPVRVISILLHVSRTTFSGAANTLAVFEGSSSFSGARLFVVSGVDLLSTCSTLDEIDDLPDSSPLRLVVSDAYQQRYESALALINSPLICHVDVPSSEASISFSSRDADGRHFVGTYTYAFECAIGTELNSSNQCAPPSAGGSVALAAILSVCGIVVVLSLGWVLRERYVRQRAHLAKTRKMISDDDDDIDGEIKPDATKRRLFLGHVWSLKKEMGQQVIALVGEVTLVVLTWVNVALLASAEDSSVGDSYLNVTYVTVAVISLMGFLANAIARGLTLHQSMRELRDYQASYNRAWVGSNFTASTPTENSKLLRQAHGRLFQLQIVSVAVLFDNLPMLILNLLRLRSDTTEVSLRYLLQCVLGAFLIGIKMDRLMGMNVLRDHILDLRLKVYDAKLASRHRSTVTPGESREIGVTAHPDEPNLSPPLAIPSASISNARNGEDDAGSDVHEPVPATRERPTTQGNGSDIELSDIVLANKDAFQATGAVHSNTASL